MDAAKMKASVAVEKIPKKEFVNWMTRIAGVVSSCEKEVEMGKLEIKDKEKTLIIHEISCIAKEKNQEIKSWEERYTKSTASHDDEVKKLNSRLAVILFSEQAVEIKQLREASTRNQEEMKSMKIHL
uniref:PH01B001E05.15 protein n=1 Tax=Phyllostachys edulis TaxID=38705 RepID=L0P1V3_PHYED|nr:PH01B001E05.15 [Phyllostachys edulis]